MPNPRIAADDEITRTYLDEIGAIPLLNAQQEREYALPIQRSEHIQDLRQRCNSPEDVNVAHRVLRRIYNNAAPISGLCRVAQMDPDPRLSEMARQQSFRRLTDNPPTSDVADTVRRWTGLQRESTVASRLQQISLDTMSVTEAMIHLTDDCRLSDLGYHVDDKTFRTRTHQIKEHITRELDVMCEEGHSYKSKLAEGNLRLVVSIAKHYAGLNIPMLDLVQEGNIGLMTSTERFNLWLGNKFSTYATWWIKHNINQCLTKQRRTVRLPEHKIKLISQITAARRTLSQDNQKTPSDQEVAEYLEISVDLIRNADVIRQPMANLQDPLSDDSETVLGDTIASLEPTVEEEVCDNNRKEMVRKALSLLPKLQGDVLTLRYGLIDDNPQAVSVIAAQLGVSNQDVREAEKAGMDQLQTRVDIQLMLADFRR